MKQRHAELTRDRPAPAGTVVVADPLCEIDLEAIGHNVEALRSHLGPGTGIMAVVKADAYGHGAVAVAAHLERLGVSFFAVATVREGVELRRNGVTGRILVLIPVLPFELENAVTHDLTLSLASLSEAELLHRVATHLGTRAEAHLMVDTGLSRGGFHPAELRRDLPELRALSSPSSAVDLRGIWGHFPAVHPRREARRTAARFHELVGHAKRFLALPYVHMASSQAIADLPESHFNLVRPGLALYGYLSRPRGALNLRPAMRVTAPVVSVKRYDAGTPVSYERTYVLGRSAGVATVRFGYADGYAFGLGNTGTVVIEEKPYPVIGRVTMDQLLAEVGDDPVLPGHRAVLLGPPGPRADELAAAAGTIPYTLLTATGVRVRKLWRSGEEIVAGP
jgi:alanine racemase